MKKKLAMQWVKALRSGKFNQGQNDLRKVSGGEITHCCLGVLGEICNIDVAVLTRNAALEADLGEQCGLEHNPVEVYNADGLGTPVKGKIRIKVRGETKKFSNLAEANDAGASFKVIASWIEKNYEKL